MRRLLLFVLLICLLLPVAAVFAQDATPATPAAPQNDEVDRIIVTLSSLVAEAEKHAQEVDDGVSRAFDLLGIFEVGGVLITVIAGGVGVFGFTRLFSAQNELTKARERIEHEQEELRKRFEKQLEDKEAELEQFRQALETGVAKQRETTAQALLGQSLLPLGERQYLAQDHEGALATYHRALELDPNNPITHYRLGYVYVQSNDLEKAKHYFSSSMTLEDNFAPAMAGLGFTYRKIAEKMERSIEREQMMNKAESLLLDALKLSPSLIDDDGESWWGALGGLYRRRGQTDQAIDAYERATRVTPHSSYGFGNLALLYMEKHNQERMLDTYKRVERLAWAEAQAEANNYWGYSDVVVARLALGKSEEVNEALDTTLELASAEYQLDMLIDTLTRLQDAVEPEKVADIKRVVDVIKAHKKKVFNTPGTPKHNT